MPWGKAGAGDVPHPLICHVLDTAAVARVILPLYVGAACLEELRRAFRPLGDPDGWIAVLVGLHDLGKCSPAFQALRADLAARLLDSDMGTDVRQVDLGKRPGERTDTLHGFITAARLEALLLRWGCEAATAREIASVVGGHHGIMVTGSMIKRARSMRGDYGGGRWASACEQLVEETVRLLGVGDPAVLPWDEVSLSAVAKVALAGLTSVSDWIASGYAEFAGADVDLERYAGEIDAKAERWVAKLGWTRWTPPDDVSFAGLFPTVVPRPVQRVVERVVNGLAGPALVIVEVPTGEGKTKAALQAVAALVKRFALIGFYFATPTKATSRVMRAEAQEMVDRSDVPLLVRLAYGGSAADMEVESAKRIAEADIDADGQGAMEAAEWFTGPHRPQLFAAGAGTVDQAQKAAIRTKFNFVRMGALTGKVVVIDEMHAYDLYMSTHHDRLLMWLGRCGVPVVVLSATLPSARRRGIVDMWRAGRLGVAVADLPLLPLPGADYPRVTWTDGHAGGCESVEVSDVNKERTVRLARVAGDEELVASVLDQAERGRTVAVVHNIKKRMYATHQELAARIARLPEDRRPELLLLHGDLAAAVRAAREERLLAALGRDGTPPENGMIVVGTQVIEQSLDYSVDVMFSDIAPIDLLIQRVGRLQRFGARDFPAVLYLCDVTDTAKGPRFTKGQTAVYDKAILMRTWAMLRGRQTITTPSEVAGLVDAVYGADAAVPCPDGWSAEWVKAAASTRYKDAGIRDEARTRYIPMPHDGVRAAELTERPQPGGQTRLNRGKP